MGPRGSLDVLGEEEILLPQSVIEDRVRVVTAPTALSELLVKNEWSCLHLLSPIRLHGEQSDSDIRCRLYQYRRFPRRLYPPAFRTLLVSLVAVCAQISVKSWDG